MSVTKTFTVTVVGGNPSNHPYHNFGSTNKYAIDGSTATSDVTLTLEEGGTYRFDQSDSSNGNHPLRFSTTANGTHGGGSEYTTGVTTNGIPGQAGAYTQITVADDAPTLYYYCTNHSGMGWTANTVDSSITRTFTVTVVSTGSGNKYFIDGVQQATLLLGEGGTYKFDQSDSSNGNHPLRFSTTSDGTHNSGSQYTTGVTTNGTPGQAGSYTQIVVAESAPTLYYYCTNHSGMGGQANTVDGNSWGIMSWGANEYGSQDSIDITLTGVSTTSSVGSVEAFNAAGWGRQEWGNSGWGVDYAVLPTGVSATSTVGSVTAFDTVTVIPTGQSATSSVGSITTGVLSIADLTGVQATSELGSFDNAGTLVGWGRNGWGEEPYGDSFNSLVQPAGVSATASVGSVTAAPETIVSLTGLSSTSATGSLGFVISPVVIPTGLSLTSNVGAASITQATVGLTGLGMTSAVGGIVLDALVVELDGLSTTSSVGFVSEQIIQVPTGVSATSSVGTLVPEIGIPLTGVSATSSVGALSFVFSQDITLTGVQATTELNDSLILQYYNRLVPKDSTGYTRKVPKNTTGYTRKVAN